VGALLAGLPGAPEVLGVEAADADPARALAAVARDWGADLIVVGIDRVGWLRRHLLGGAHERLVDRARCAVLVVPAAAREARRAAGSAPAGTPGARAAAARGGA
jgi:nucleotide-binding universal stress UspA family protein